ncbi:hypothetical protein KR51_00014540 [Rubidibacter lacunae KORDI 51-2]|uniref:Glycosyltransferase RgtA/B/C/D-like domain-containing protein n=1 Tax=Rubidibacter lacunae KORDI 51-2 TaxID=582515 RepID=U5DMS7_9CHRO|nr:hypothetical protein [Rubidibacter lacunae]ERN41919.1 hypothetical protein KR51_00014540 [Rubidibacter lacunae KORDI 51-2]
MPYLQLYLLRIRAITQAERTRLGIAIWLGASLAIAILYGIWGLQETFSTDYVVASDVRQHVFWLLRYFDPELFTNDLIADYFESVSPAGFTAVYRSAISLGADPIWFSKILPIPIAIGMTVYCFLLVLELLPVPVAGFFASVLLLQIVWLNNDVPSATPRAFLYVFFPAFLYYLLRRSPIGCAISVALLGLFYPQYVLLSALVALVRLLDWTQPKLRLNRDPRDRVLCFTILAVAFVVLLPFAIGSSEYGPVVTYARGQFMAVFSENGRTPIFRNDPVNFYLGPGRTGLFPRALLTPATLAVGLLLPGMLLLRKYFPLGDRTRNLSLIPQLMTAAILLYCAAHAFLFRLHLPSRYTNHSFKITVAVTAGVALTLLLDGLAHWAIARQATKNPKNSSQIIAGGVATLLLACLLLYPRLLIDFPGSFYPRGGAVDLYQYLETLPKSIVIASLSDESDNIPTFARRSVLASWRLLSPYHLGYYEQMHQRAIAVINAQYASNPAEVKATIAAYDIDYWLLDRQAFSPEYLSENRWFGQWPDLSARIIREQQSKTLPVLEQLQATCSTFESKTHVVLSARCILNQ